MRYQICIWIKDPGFPELLEINKKFNMYNLGNKDIPITST